MGERESRYVRELIRLIGENKSYNSLNGLFYRHNSKFIHNPLGDPIQNLGDIPYLPGGNEKIELIFKKGFFEDTGLPLV